MEEVAREKGVSIAALAYAWLLHQPGVSSPIIVICTPGQLDQALEALEIRLSAGELARLAAPYQPHPIIGHG